MSKRRIEQCWFGWIENYFKLRVGNKSPQDSEMVFGVLPIAESRYCALSGVWERDMPPDFGVSAQSNARYAIAIVQT